LQKYYKRFALFISNALKKHTKQITVKMLKCKIDYSVQNGTLPQYAIHC